MANLFLWGRGKIMKGKTSLYIIILVVAMMAFPFRSFAASAENDLQGANKNIIEAMHSVQNGKMEEAKNNTNHFHLHGCRLKVE